MTAIYSQEPPEKVASFHSTPSNAAGEVVKLDARKSTGREPEDSHIEELRKRIETPGKLPQALQSGGPWEAISWAEIDEQVCLAQTVEFSDACEEDFARLLDSRDIAWRYKPRTFAVEWDEDGNFVDCFTPDFYLPENGTYIALIAPGRAFNAKPRKVKLLRRHHPDIRIELLRGSPDRRTFEAALTNCRGEIVQLDARGSFQPSSKSQQNWREIDEDSRRYPE